MFWLVSGMGEDVGEGRKSGTFSEGESTGGVAFFVLGPAISSNVGAFGVITAILLPDVAVLAALVVKAELDSATDTGVGAAVLAAGTTEAFSAFGISIPETTEDFSSCSGLTTRDPAS